MKLFTLIVLSLVLWPALAADPPAAPKPRAVTKISMPLEAGSKEVVTVVLDTADAPDWNEWGLKAANYALKWYPELAKQLPGEGFVPPREFTILIKKHRGVADTGGGVITINTDYIKNHKDDFGMVAHELVHVIQRYRRTPGNAGWLVEGIADYVRYYVVEPGSKNAGFDARADYKRGYQPAAALLNYAEKKAGAGTVAKLNQSLRDGKYDDTTFKKVTGAEADDLWREFKDSIKK